MVSIFKRQIPAVLKRHLSTSTPVSSWIFSNEASKSTGHSSLLADKNEVFEVLVEDVSPRYWDDYLAHKAEFMPLLEAKTQNHCELIASWRFIHGDVNFRAMHLFKYSNGWTDIDKARKLLKNDQEFSTEEKKGWQLMKRQETEFMKAFSYWPMPDKRSGGHIYDVRSYRLKPGSMYDWGNYWAKGINCRKNVRDDIPYGGFFSQLGRLHTIYHIWCYNDLADRKQCREGTWHNPGWNDVVSNTVPLIRSMSTRILEPLPFSPTQ